MLVSIIIIAFIFHLSSVTEFKMAHVGFPDGLGLAHI